MNRPLSTLAIAIFLAATGTAHAVEGTLAFTGARIIDGTGAEPIENGIIIVTEGRITAIGAADELDIPAAARRLDMTGQTIMPGLINSHGHVSGIRGLENGHYTAENIHRQLALYARYGVTTVNSLGDDGPEGFQVRDSQSPDSLNEARLLVTGPVLAPRSVEDAVAAVKDAAESDPAFIKIRVDDNLGRTPKMAADIYSAISQQADAEGIPLAVHTYSLQDTKDLLRAGADFVAHSVRDVEVDREFVDLMTQRDICYSPTLTRELSTYVYENEPGFFTDPFFLSEVDPAVVETLRDPARQQQLRSSASAQQYKASLPIAMRNMVQLANAGVRIALGTDSGPAARFQGYFEHLEMWMMADAGMEPMQVLQSATSVAASCLGLDDTGTLVPGNWADLLILERNPLEDIRNTRTIHSVWIAGNAVQRPERP